VRQNIIAERAWWREMLTSWQAGSKKERNREGGKGEDTLQKHTPNNLLLPTRPHLPPLPSTDESTNKIRSLITNHLSVIGFTS
jgi:hypothetical protein